jgi:site-specific recombinase XerD
MNTEMIKKEVIMPKLNDCRGDLSRQWFIYFSILNPATGRMKTFRKYDGFARLKTDKERRTFASKVIRKWEKKILSGWNPFFEQEKYRYTSLIRYDANAKNNGNVVESPRNFEYYSTRYLTHVKEVLKLRPSSYTTYKSKLRNFEFYLVERGIDKINLRFYNTETITDFNKWLMKKRNLEGKGINEYNEALNRFFKYMIREEKYLTVNPVDEVIRYQEKTVSHKAFNDTYIKEIRHRVEEKSPYIWLMCRMIYSCFTRPKELRLLQMKHFNWSDGTILMPAEISKNKRERLITIPNYLLKIFIEKGYTSFPGDYYLMSLQGEPGPEMVHRNWLYRKLKTVFKEMNLPKGYTLYSFKHTGVQQLARNKVDLVYIKGQLGHKSLDEMLPYIEELLMQGNDEIRYKSPEI